MTQGFRCRGWCFTINNDTYDDLDLLLNADFTYLIFGFEEGDKKKTPHIQGYIHFENAKTAKSVSKIIPRGHLSGARGTPKQNFEYCSKDGEFYEFGTQPEPGKRSDLIRIRELFDEGANMEYIMDEYPSDYIRYWKGLQAMHNVIKKKKIDREVKYMSATQFAEKELDSFFICNNTSSLNHYDDEYYLVIWSTKKFDTYDLELLTLGYPLYTSSRVINPPSLIIIRQTLAE